MQGSVKKSGQSASVSLKSPPHTAKRGCSQCRCLKILTTPKAASVDTTNPDLAPVEQQAAGFEAVREARRSETAEDYVELIDDLIKATGEARVVDVAARMGVSHATVNRILSRLAKEGLVSTQPYRSIFLTEAGLDLAQESRERHRIVVEFLCALGIDETTAERDAEGIEHYVSAETITAFQQWTGKLSAGKSGE